MGTMENNYHMHSYFSELLHSVAVFAEPSFPSCLPTELLSMGLIIPIQGDPDFIIPSALPSTEENLAQRRANLLLSNQATGLFASFKSRAVLL